MKKYSLKKLLVLIVLFVPSVFGSSSTLQTLDKVIDFSQSRHSEKVFEGFYKILQIISRLREMDPKKIKISDEELLEVALGLSSCELWEPFKVEESVSEKIPKSRFDFLRAYFPCCFCRKKHDKKN